MTADLLLAEGVVMHLETLSSLPVSGRLQIVRQNPARATYCPQPTPPKAAPETGGNLRRHIAIGLMLITGILPPLVQADTLQTIRETGVIRLAHRDGAIPFSYVDGSGHPLGFTVDLCNRLANHLREQLKMPALRTQWMQVSSAERMQVVKDGKADMECGSTTNNPERRQQYMFTMPIFLAGIKIMSRESLAAQNLDALIGKRVAANSGTTAARLLGFNNKERLTGIRAIETKDHAEAWKLLEDGKIDAWLTDDVLLAAYRATSAKPEKFVLSTRFLTIEPYGIVLRHDDAALASILNAELARMMRAGEFKRLYDTWFQQPIPGRNVNLKLPMNEMLRAQLASPTDVLPATF